MLRQHTGLVVQPTVNRSTRADKSTFRTEDVDCWPPRINWGLGFLSLWLHDRCCVSSLRLHSAKRIGGIDFLLSNIFIVSGLLVLVEHLQSDLMSTDLCDELNVTHTFNENIC